MKIILIKLLKIYITVRVNYQRCYLNIKINKIKFRELKILLNKKLVIMKQNQQ